MDSPHAATGSNSTSPGSVPGFAGPLLVTGADGLLGREVITLAAARGWVAAGVGRTETDIVDAAATHACISAFAPTVIVHCAAYTKVDDAEGAADTAHAVNETGTQNVVAAARALGAYVIGISTDYVFDGSNPAGYEEGDEPRPANIYGLSKLAGEGALLGYELGAVARTSWLFGSGEGNFVTTIDRLSRSDQTLRVVDDQIGSPTYAPHLARALLECAAQRNTGIFHLAGAPAATWCEVATRVVATNGTQAQITPVSSAEFPRAARRPTCSILRSTRSDAPEVGDWREGIDELLRQ